MTLIQNEANSIDGIIYEIYHKDHICPVYVGSTTTALKKRWMHHKNKYKRYKQGLTPPLSVYKLFDYHGFDNFRISIIKIYKVTDRNHLKAYEQLHINKKNCVNMIASYCPIPVNERHKITYKKNKRALEWYYENRDRILQYRQEVVICECGRSLQRGNLSDHRKTAIHLKLLNDKNNISQ